jgi:hypothetical protein
MLFPGHERSQRLLCGSLQSGHNSEAQECANNEKNRHARSSQNSELLESFEQILACSPSPAKKQRQSPTSGMTQTGVKLDDRWPNGTPPTGPRKSLNKAGRCQLRRQSAAGEIGQRPTVNGKSSRWTQPKSSLSLIYHTGIQSPRTTESVDKASSDMVTEFECLRETNPWIPDYGQKSSKIGIEARTMVSKRTTTPELMGQLNGTHDVQQHKNFNFWECPPSEVDTLLGPADASRVPISSLPQSPSVATESPAQCGSGERRPSSRHPAAQTYTMDMTSPSGTRHRDNSVLTKQTWMSGNGTASVTSSTSRTARISCSSTASSSLRFSVCHSCKKPRFKEKLKGCVECSRHYHKGCAQPQDR